MKSKDILKLGLTKNVKLIMKIGLASIATATTVEVKKTMGILPYHLRPTGNFRRNY